MADPIKKIAGVILAAGSASRMGETKQLLAFKGRPILEHVIKNARQSNLYEIIVVLGHDTDKIQQVVDFSGTKTVTNSEYLKGQSTSLIKGVKTISPICDAAMFLLADQPLIKSSIINNIINAFESSQKSIIIPYYKKTRGNPVIVDSALFPDLNLLSGDTGPRVLFKKFKNSIFKVSIQDKAILIDIDTKEDYQKFITLIQKKADSKKG